VAGRGSLVNRTAILKRFRDVVSVDETLKGSDDRPAGLWPGTFGPVVLEWADADKLERTAIWMGDPRGLSAVEDAWGDGISVWEDEWAFDVWGSIGATDSATACELGEALISAVRTIVSRNRALVLEGEADIDTLLAVSCGPADGPSRFPAEDGAGVVATVRIEVRVKERG
jgi:hypothetical protein